MSEFKDNVYLTGTLEDTDNYFTLKHPSCSWHEEFTPCWPREPFHRFLQHIKRWRKQPYKNST